MRLVTLCLLVDRENKKVLLAMKKRGFGEGKWNGLGGKVDESAKESVEDAMAREVYEEIGVEVKKYYKVAVFDFIFKFNGDFSQRMHTFIATEWVDEPKETEEMRPQWFAWEDIPYDEMWEPDRHWIPKVLKGKRLIGRFVFGDNNQLIEKQIKKIKNNQDLTIEDLY